VLLLALSACSGAAPTARFSDLEKAEQSLPQVDTVLRREVANNCEGDSPTGPAVYLWFALPSDGQVPNEKWTQALRASGWRSDSDSAFHRKSDASQVVAVVNQTRIANDYAVVLYLKDGVEACPAN